MAEIQKEEEDVLILVLMDNQNTIWKAEETILACLNPCSNG